MTGVAGTLRIIGVLVVTIIAVAAVLWGFGMVSQETFVNIAGKVLLVGLIGLLASVALGMLSGGGNDREQQ